MIADASPQDSALGEVVGRKGAVLRRVIVEVPRQDPECLGRLTSPGVIESFRVIHLFRFDPRSYDGICRVKFRDPGVGPSQMVGQIGISKAECLARLADGARLVHIEGRPTAEWARFAALTGGAMYPAFQLTPDSWRVTAVGSSDQMRGFLAELRHFKMPYKVLSIEDADLGGPSPKLPMDMLTPKQREALIAAYRSGYYDIPKRADSAAVAKALALGKSTTLEHLRKAEKRLLDTFMQVGGEVGTEERVG
jgi:HTH DNA binding domain